MMRWYDKTLGIGLLLGLALQSWPVAADFRDDYKRGIETLERGQWSQAASLFRQAAAERPDEKARLSRSPFSKRYLPHFYLGEALLEMDDCEGALTAWAESERQGVVTRLPEYQSLIDGRDICRRQAATRFDSQRRAEVEISNAEAAARRVDRLQTDLGPNWPGAASSLGARETDAEQRLRAARSQLTAAVASEDLDGMRQSAALAREARQLLETVEREAIQHQAQLRLQQGALIAEVGRLTEQAETQVRATSPLRPYPRELGRIVAEVSGLIEESRQAGPTQDLDDLSDLRAALEDAMARLQDAAAPPPAALAEAAGLFFDGDYEAALELLGGLQSVSSKVALQTHILRAAASFTLYQLGGGDGAELLESAQSEVAACLEIDAANRPPAGPFSPRFIEFFESQAAASNDETTVAAGPAPDASD